MARLFSSLAVAMGEAGDLEDVLVAGMVESARWLRWHEPLTYLLEHEPGAVLPYVTFGGFDQVMRVAERPGAPRSSPAGSSPSRPPGRPSGPCASSWPTARTRPRTPT